MKTVAETPAGKQISAWIIMKGSREVGCVRAHYSHSGRVSVNVFNYGPKNPDAEELGFQSGHAGGYGYDKFTAALSGLSIDGVKMGNHCQFSKKMPKGGFRKKAPRGWCLTNNAKFNENGEQLHCGKAERDETPGYWAFTSCYRESGFSLLEALGYKVIQAI